jgi:hypothetical protein
MANQGIRDENPALTAVVTGAVNGDTINYTLATTATSILMLGISIAVTLELILTIVLFQLMGFFSVTQKYCCNSNSRWQIKVLG